MGTTGLPWGQQSGTVQLLVPATGTVPGKGKNTATAVHPLSTEQPRAEPGAA